MPLETGNTVADLNENWPLGSDPKSQGDDHFRLIKSVLAWTFENLDDQKLADIVGQYLPLSGGTLTGLLQINRTSNGAITFNRTGRVRLDYVTLEGVTTARIEAVTDSNYLQFVSYDALGAEPTTMQLTALGDVTIGGTRFDAATPGSGSIVTLGRGDVRYAQLSGAEFTGPINSVNGTSSAYFYLDATKQDGFRLRSTGDEIAEIFPIADGTNLFDFKIAYSKAGGAWFIGSAHSEAQEIATKADLGASFDSGFVDFTLNGVTEFAHGLGVSPERVDVMFRFKSSLNGWTAGEVISSSSLNLSTTKAFAAYGDGTHAGICVGSVAAGSIMSRSNPAAALGYDLTPANCEVRVLAWK